MREPQKIAIAIITLITVALALAATTYAALSTSQSLSSSGSVTVVATASLGLYSDSACTTPLTSISWGSLTPGGNKTQTLYIKNTGTVSLTLSMATSNWNPTTANGPITVTWNRAGTVLSSGQSTSAIITLVVSSGISDITNFNVQISITGTQ
jgi:archaellum component FlaG (FlaF/FlaG flagellin family)